MRLFLSLVFCALSLGADAIQTARPRILLTSSELTRLRTRCTFHATTAPLCTGTDAPAWTTFKTEILVPYTTTTPTSSIAAYAASFALAYAITGYTAYGDRAEALAADSANEYGTTLCVNPNTFRSTFYFLAALYDWAYSFLSGANKTLLQNVMKTQVSCWSGQGNYDKGTYSPIVGVVPQGNIEMGAFFSSVWSWIALFGDLPEDPLSTTRIYTVTNLSQTAGVLTVTTSSAHDFLVGWPVGLENCASPFAARTGLITAVTSTTITATVGDSDGSCIGTCGASCKVRAQSPAPQLRFNELRTTFLAASPGYLSFYGGAGEGGAQGVSSIRGGAMGEGFEYDVQSYFNFILSMMAIKTGTGEDMIASMPYNPVAQIIRWMLYSSSPDGPETTNSTVPLTYRKHSPFFYGDVETGSLGTYTAGARQALQVARSYSTGISDTTTASLAQWMMQTDTGAASALDGLIPLYSGSSQGVRGWVFDALFTDGTVAATAPTSLVPYWHASGMGRWTARSNWNRTATLVYGECRPVIGGGGHRHGDCLNIGIYRNGGWLITETPEYNGSATALHATLTADGRGNFGDGASGSAYGNPSTTFSGSAAYSYARMDGTGVYRTSQTPINIPTSNGVIRHVLYLPNDTMVIADQVNYEATYPTVPTVWFWPAYTGTPSVGGTRITYSNNTPTPDQRAYLDVVHPTGVTISTIAQDKIAVTGVIKGATTELTTTRRVTRTVGGTVTIAGYSAGCAVLNGVQTISAVATSYYSKLRFSVSVNTSGVAENCSTQAGEVGTASTGAGYVRAQYVTPSLRQNDYGMVVIQGADSADPPPNVPTTLTSGSANVIGMELGNNVVVSPIGSGYPSTFNYSGFSSAEVRTHRVFVTPSTSYTVDCTTTPGTCSITTGAGTTSSSAGILEFNTTGGGPGTLTSFTVSCPTTPITAGGSQNCTATAKDELGNTLTSYTGSPTCTTVDPQAIIGSCASFVSGAKTISLVLKTAGGPYTLNVADGGATGESGSIVVNAAAATSCTLTGIETPRSAGVAATATAAYFDAYSNPSVPTGNNTFTSSDGAATLPAATTCPTTSCTYSVTLNTPGTQSVQNANAGGSFNCSQSGITVNSSVPLYFKGKN